MIPLPEPKGILHDALGNDPLTFVASPWPPLLEICCSTSHIYTADQLRAYGDAVRAEERERCAQICDSYSSVEGIAQQCAAAIRSAPRDG